MAFFKSAAVLGQNPKTIGLVTRPAALSAALVMGYRRLYFFRDN